MRHGLISNNILHMLLVKHGSLGLEKMLEFGFSEGDKSQCFLLHYFFHAPFN